MTTIKIIAFLAFVLPGCNSSQTVGERANNQNEIVETANEILYQVRENGGKEITSWISIKEPESQLKYLIGKDDIVLESKEAILLIDYPLKKPIEIEITSSNSNGFKRGELIQIISREYKRIYKEEEESAKSKTIPFDKREGIINRNETDGKYGIWGHDLGDLDLSTIVVKKSSDGRPILELYIES